MLEMQIEALADIPTEAWRNGGGLTTTVAQGGDDWRVSIAQIQREGPYSRFEGTRRISLVLRGSGVKLKGNDTVVLLKPAEAIEYDRGSAWYASLVDGPVVALNVMRATLLPRPHVSVVVSPTTVSPNCASVVVALDGGCSISEAGTEELRFVEPGHVAVIKDVRRPFTVTPTFASSSAASGCVRLPVLVTIKPGDVRINS